MRLTPAQRETVRLKFDGCCAYCGDPLGARWHADHFEPVIRDSVWKSGVGFKPTGLVLRPQNDTIDNFMPSCAPCNIDKSSMSLEAWRAKLARGPQVLARNNPTFRHAVRFGLVQVVDRPVVFHFESYAAWAGDAACTGMKEGLD